MPDKPDEEIRKSIKRFEESLPESERNPDAQENTERLIERAAQPLPKDEDTPHILTNVIAKNKLVHVKLKILRTNVMVQTYPCIALKSVDASSP